MVKVIALFKRKNGITLEEFSRYWYEKHWPFAHKIIPKDVYAGVKKYVQNPAIRLQGGGEPPFDGVLELQTSNPCGNGMNGISAMPGRRFRTTRRISWTGTK